MVVGSVRCAFSAPERLLRAWDTFLFLVMCVVKPIFLNRLA